MSDETADRIYSYAMGLGEARIKQADAIEELIALAGNEAGPIQKALERTRKLVESMAEKPTQGTDDSGPPEAPALLASRLLAEALESLDSRSG